MTFAIDRIDHVVINCRNVEATAAWYERALGLKRVAFGGGRVALAFGRQKLNLRPTGAENWETGRVDAPGSLDLCFITTATPAEVKKHLESVGVAVTEGPVAKTGALGPMTSVYCRDPDGNLVEIATYP
jgi:catechol 2,3-dioxygenase-like lactoylglutathione lyase family enzyme